MGPKLRNPTVYNAFPRFKTQWNTEGSMRCTPGLGCHIILKSKQAQHTRCRSLRWLGAEHHVLIASLHAFPELSEFQHCRVIVSALLQSCACACGTQRLRGDQAASSRLRCGCSLRLQSAASCNYHPAQTLEHVSFSMWNINFSEIRWPWCNNTDAQLQLNTPEPRLINAQILRNTDQFSGAF